MEEKFGISENSNVRLAQELYKEAGLSTNMLENMFPFLVIGGVALIIVAVMGLVLLIKNYRYKILKWFKRLKR